MTDQKPRKPRTFIYSELEHTQAKKNAIRLVKIKEALKPINNIVSKIRTDRIIKK